MSDRVSLTQVPRKLRPHLKGRGQTPGYRTTYNAAVDGRIPAEQGENGRWTVAFDDLPLIAATLCRGAACDAPVIMARRRTATQTGEAA